MLLEKLNIYNNTQDINKFQAENQKRGNYMKYAVVSYWIGETGDTELWLYDTENEAIEALNRLWEQSYNLALEDEDFDEDNSYHEDYFAVVAWKDELYRYFEVVKQNEKEVIRQFVEGINNNRQCFYLRRNRNEYYSNRIWIY